MENVDSYIRMVDKRMFMLKWLNWKQKGKRQLISSLSFSFGICDFLLMYGLLKVIRACQWVWEGGSKREQGCKALEVINYDYN